MARLNVNRALVAIGQGLGDFAQIHYQKERDRVMAQRDENMLRLQATLGEQSRANERNWQSGEAEKDRQARAAADAAHLAQSDRHHRESIGVQREGLGIQREQLDQTRIQNLEKGYMAQLEAIDGELSEINSYLTEARAEGKVVDESALAPYQSRLSELQGARTNLLQERAYMLARGGDNRYVKLTPEQVAELRKQGKLPGAGTAAQGPKPNAKPPTQPAPAAPAAVPPPPPAPEKPPGMQAREARKQQQEDRRAIVGEAGKGMKQAREVVSRVGDALSARRNEGPLVGSFKRGEKLSDEQRQQLRSIGRARLKGVYKLSDEDLAKIF